MNQEAFTLGYEVNIIPSGGIALRDQFFALTGLAELEPVNQFPEGFHGSVSKERILE